MANYTTNVEAVKTIGEIQEILVKHRAKAILTNYGADGLVESLSFIVPTAYGDLPFRLPVNAASVLKVLQRERVPNHFLTKAQAVRIAWRMLKIGSEHRWLY